MHPYGSVFRKPMMLRDHQALCAYSMSRQGFQLVVVRADHDLSPAPGCRHVISHMLTDTPVMR